MFCFYFRSNLTKRDVEYYYFNNQNNNQNTNHHKQQHQSQNPSLLRHNNNHQHNQLDLAPSSEKNTNLLSKYWYLYGRRQQNQIQNELKLERKRRDTQQNEENNEIETTTQLRRGSSDAGGVRDRQRERGEQERDRESSSSEKVSAFTDDEIGWTRINEEVDIVIPKVLNHFETLGITHLDLPEIRETLSIVSV